MSYPTELSKALASLTDNAGRLEADTSGLRLARPEEREVLRARLQDMITAAHAVIRQADAADMEAANLKTAVPYSPATPPPSGHVHFGGRLPATSCGPRPWGTKARRP